MKYVLEEILRMDEDLFEGPIFDKKLGYLYFVSILACKIYRYNPRSGVLNSITLQTPTSCIFLTDQFGIVVASQSGFYQINFETGSYNLCFKVDIPENVRFNDGILDARGRFLIGTMGFPEVISEIGSLYSIENGISKILIENVTISNGITFTEDSKFMFYIDTPTKCIKKYRYDLSTGNCIFINKIINLVGDGFPDGLEIDKNGNLWVAEWGGGCISIWSSIDGRLIEKIDFPVENVTSLCFDNDMNLYVTTAKSDSNSYSSLYYVKIESK